MNLFFDEDSQKLIVCAKEEMFKLKHPYVGSEHLMLAILKNNTLGVTKCLNDYGISYEVFRDALIKSIGIGNKSNEWFLFTPLLKSILNNAIYYSKDNSGCVTPNCLLISILQEGDGVANRILISLNIDLDALYDRFVSYGDVPISKRNTILDTLAINMNNVALSGGYDPIIGRNDELERIIQILIRKSKNNPLLIGEAGVGKTAIVEELARKIASGDVPFKLKNKIIYNLPISNLVANTKYRGEFEERLKKIIDEIVENTNIILFIDEVHTIVGAGGAEGAIDASNVIKPFLARGEIKVIGATTLDEYSKYISVDKALDRRFQKVFVEEPNKEKTKNILMGLKPVYEKFHNVSITDELISFIIDMSEKYINFGMQPDKSIDLLDEVCAYTVASCKKNIELKNYETKIRKIEDCKNKEILNHNFKKALFYRSKEIKLMSDYNDVIINSNCQLTVDKKIVYDVIYKKTKIPIFSYLNDLTLNLEKNLKKYIFSQNSVIHQISSFLKDSNYLSKNKPLSFLLVGKNGVGKTFLAEKIAELVFDSDSYIKINMNEYKEPSSINKIIGVSAGYVGYNDVSVLHKVKERPFSLIIFDDIDKCCSSISRFILKMISDGFFTTAKGEKIDISKCIIIMTSTANRSKIGFDSKTSNNVIYNGVNHVISFNNITKKDVIDYINKKFGNCYDFNNDDLDYFVNSSQYAKFGFKLIDDLVENRFCLSKINS